MSINRRGLKLHYRFEGLSFPPFCPAFCCAAALELFISLLHFLNLPVSLPILSSIVPSIVLGLLLVFRTNTAYERFWEGRRFWGTLNNNVRNLARQIWVAIEEKDPQDIVHQKVSTAPISCLGSGNETALAERISQSRVGAVNVPSAVPKAQIDEQSAPRNCVLD